MKRTWVNHTFCLGLLLLSPVAKAQIRPMGLQDLTQNAAAIVIGKCIEVESRWVGKQIYTFVKIKIDESLKGALAQTVTVTIPGGRVQAPWPMEMTVSHAPSFNVGEEVLLFLWHTPSGKYVVLGLSQGKFLILIDQKTGQKFVDHYPAMAESKESDKNLTQAKEPAKSKISLRELTQEITTRMKKE